MALLAASGTAKPTMWMVSDSPPPPPPLPEAESSSEPPQAVTARRQTAIRATVARKRLVMVGASLLRRDGGVETGVPGRCRHPTYFLSSRSTLRKRSGSCWSTWILGRPGPSTGGREVPCCALVGGGRPHDRTR